MDQAVLNQLYEEMVKRFDIEELRLLSFYLDIDHENFSARKGSFVRQLIEYLERSNRLPEPELVQTLIRMRPEGDWNLIFALAGQTQAALTWQQMQDYAQRQHGRFWQAMQEIRVFLPELYVSSPQAESELADFLAGDAAALIILGETGVGKTNLLCQWTSDLIQNGHAVFYYDCAGSIEDKIEANVARDLGNASPADLPDLLSQINQLAANDDSCFVLIFDAINEYRRANQVGTAALLRDIDRMVGQLPGRNVKVVFSCRTIPWRRLRNVDVPHLLWQHYHKPSGSEDSHLLLQPFDAATVRLAYEKYQDHFALRTAFDELPAALLKNIAYPDLLRVVAEAYSERSVPDGLILSAFERYYEKRVETKAEKRFIRLLVEAMYECSRSILWLDDLEPYPALLEEILNEEPDSVYQRMLARGVLSETPGDRFQSAQVRFRHDSVGSYALALYLLRQPDRDGSRLTDLVYEKREFHLAWEAALILLLLQPDAKTFVQFAQSQDRELRELAVTALVQYYAAEPQDALNIIEQLLDLESAEAQHTALKAAYLIGSQAQSVFLEVASSRNDALRQVTKDALYLIWCNNPDFVNDLLKTLTSSIDLKAVHQIGYILDFVIDLSVTIYINHCDEAGVAQQISDLFEDLLKNQLPLLDSLGSGIKKLNLSSTIGRVIARRALDSGVARPVMEAFQYTEATAAYRANYASDVEKDRLKRALYLVKRGSDLSPELDNIADMLQSEVPLVNLLAALPLVVQAYDNFDVTEPLMRQLFEQVNGHGRSWIIISLAVQFKDTPAQWVELLEEFTRRLITENEETYYGERGRFFEQFDIILVPLGLAYGKQGTAMPLFENLVREGVAEEQWPRLTRTLEALGPVGFYYPKAVFRTLAAAIDDFDHEEVQNMLVEPLALMRILHMDEVDTFLDYINAAEDFRRRVAMATNIRGVSNYVYRLGIYNSTAYDALYHPKMSRNFLIGSVEALIDEQDQKAFLAHYAETAIRMSQEVDYHIIEWTYPD